MNRILPTLLLTTTIAGAAVAPAVAADHKAGVREVCAKSAYVTLHAGKSFTGTVFKGQTIRVTRYSASGKYAYGFVRGHVNRHGWVEASALCK